MARLNRQTIAAPVFTHGGSRADRNTPAKELERTVATCLLWEDSFYESGNLVAARIAELCTKVPGDAIRELAIRARGEWKLRHVPLFLTVQLIKQTDTINPRYRLVDDNFQGLVTDTIANVVRRPDEMGELIALYWKQNKGKKTLTAQMKKGLAAAFYKFDEYQLAKWDRDTDIKLRDVMRLVHPQPLDSFQADLWKRVLTRTLATPDTWEVGLSAAKTPRDKKAVWTRLLAENKLGYMALLQNLRNMQAVGVDEDLIEKGLERGGRDKALPFRFLAAAKAVPGFTDMLSTALLRCLDGWQKLPGKTVLLIDVSGSMDAVIASKSTINRWEAAAALAVVLREIAEKCRVMTFSNRLVEIPNLRGLGLVPAIERSQPHGGTQTHAALRELQREIPRLDRLIIVTDEQATDRGTMTPWATHNYIVNVAPYQRGLQTGGGWTRVNGWSEGVVQWMHVNESGNWD